VGGHVCRGAEGLQECLHGTELNWAGPLSTNAVHEACHSPRARHPAALLPQAKKPLSMMRTLGTMLLPRLQPGEPDRDFAQGGWAAGGRWNQPSSIDCPAAHCLAAYFLVAY